MPGWQRVLDESGSRFADTSCILSKELPSHASLSYIKAIKEVINYLQPMMANIPSSSEASADKVSAVKRFYQSLNNVLHDKKQANCIAWSPVNRQGTIAIDEPFAGLGFSKFVRGIGENQPPLSVMLTSGTLGLSGKSGLARYTPMRSALGLKESDIKICGHYAPGHYGEIRFVLASEVVKPFASEKREVEGAQYNEAWLEYTAAMVSAAVDGGQMLCLCPSFNEVEELQHRLPDRPDIGFHARGTKLDSLIDQLQRGDINAIVTPSAWEGSVSAGKTVSSC